MRGTNTFLCIDAGSYSAKAILFKANSQGTLVSIENISETKSAGILGGMITNVSEACKTFDCLLKDVKIPFGRSKIDTYVTFSGCKTTSLSLNSSVDISGRRIVQEDVKALTDAAAAKVKEKSIKSFPYSFSLDGIEGITDPTGMSCKKLNAKVHLVVASSSALNIMESFFENNNKIIRLKGFIPSGYAAGLSCLTKDEKELGSVLLDIGSHSSTAVVFDKGQCVFCYSIPLGGYHITNDILFCSNLSRAESEATKIKSCSTIMKPALEGTLDIEYSTASVDQKLACIVRMRLEEIFELLLKGIKGLKYHTVIITGGTANITGIDTVADLVFKARARIGTPNISLLKEGKTLSPFLASVVGGMLSITEKEEALKKSNRSYLAKAIDMIGLF